MLLKGALVWDPDEGFAGRDLSFSSSGLIGPSDDNCISDLSGLKIIPGFVDTHIHGFGGADTSDGDIDGIIHMSRELVKRGITAFCPTTMTISEDEIFRVFDAVSAARNILEEEHLPHSRILGIHLEGPFLSPQRTGVQGSEHLRVPDIDLINRLEKNYPGLLRIIDIAPELDGSSEFINCLSSRYSISIAHSNADYDTACYAFENGADSVTHILNAMPPIDKRAPGIACAAFDKSAYVELISDGIHVEAPVIRMLYRTVNDDRIITVSDSMRGAGMPDGKYLLGDTEVTCRKGRTFYGPEGGLAGSVTDLMSEYRLLRLSGCDENKVIRSLTVNPYERICIEGGRLDEGYPADFLVFDGEEHIDTYSLGMSCRTHNML